jgi:membrane protein YqaA with SNARE-associated domain
VTGYFVAFGLVLAINLLPAFGPPTWAVLVLFRLHMHLDPIPLIAVGAVAAASGRFALASIAHRLSKYLAPRYRVRLDRTRRWLLRRRAGAIAGLGLFALSPVPSGQLFVAAGLLNVPLAPITIAFFAGRVVSYAGYVSAATLLEKSYGDVALNAFRSPWGIAAQVALLVLLTALPLVDWRRAE